jgi:hypothetical protein
MSTNGREETKIEFESESFWGKFYLNLGDDFQMDFKEV